MSYRGFSAFEQLVKEQTIVPGTVIQVGDVNYRFMESNGAHQGPAYTLQRLGGSSTFSHNARKLLRGAEFDIMPVVIDNQQLVQRRLTQLMERRDDYTAEQSEFMELALPDVLAEAKDGLLHEEGINRRLTAMLHDLDVPVEYGQVRGFVRKLIVDGTLKNTDSRDGVQLYTL